MHISCIDVYEVFMAANDKTARMDYTSIRVTEELADELHSRKERGETYEDVIWRALESEHPADDDGDSNPSHGRENGRDGSAVPSELPKRVDREDAQEVFEKVKEFLRSDGPASSSEIVAAAMPGHALGYDVPELEGGQLVDRYRGAWWRKVVKPALEASTEIEYRSNYSDYRFVGDSDE